MNKRKLRILVVDQNRYRTLIVSRAISGMNRIAVISRFESPVKAIDELKRNCYQAVVISSNLMTNDRKLFGQMVRNGWRDMFIISLKDLSSDGGVDWADIEIISEDISSGSLTRAFELYQNGLTDSGNVIGVGDKSIYSPNNYKERILVEF